MKKLTLYKKATTGKIVEWAIEIKDNCFRTITGFIDGAKVTSEWTCCEGKNIGRSNETTPEGQAEAEAMAIYTKRKDLGSFEKLSDVDNKTFFKPMLAHKLEDHKDKLKYPLVSEPKLDGCRCIVESHGMTSRNGKPIVSAPHIYESLKPLFEKNPDLIFDGELYCDKLSNDFNKIISLVKKTKPTKDDLIECEKVIQYHIYDLPSCDDVYIKRHEELLSLDLPECCVVIEDTIVNDERELMKEYSRLIELGYEGQMIRTPNGLYENKRSKNLLKHKTFVDDEFVIVDVLEGKGNMSGKVGRFVFEGFDSPVNGTWEYLEDLLKQRKDLIGKKATVKYFNLTPAGVPRFPKVIAIDRDSYE